MAKERLALLDCGHWFEIGWYFPDEGDFGQMIGDEPNGLPERTVMSTVSLHPVTKSDIGGWRWATRRDASRALKAIEAALKAEEASAPMPTWATKALAEGWKPPKGWKPQQESLSSEDWRDIANGREDEDLVKRVMNQALEQIAATGCHDDKMRRKHVAETCPNCIARKAMSETARKR